MFFAASCFVFFSTSNLSVSALCVARGALTRGPAPRNLVTVGNISRPQRNSLFEYICIRHRSSGNRANPPEIVCVWVWPGGLSPALALAEPYPPATARANTGAHRSPRSLTRCSSNVSARVCGDGERGNPHDDGGASPPRGLLCPTRLQHSPPPPQQSLHMLLSPLSSHAGCTAPATLPRETPHE